MMSGLHPIMAQALRPWMPPIDDPRDHLLIEATDDDEPEEEPETDDEEENAGYCPTCSGSGEGRYDGTDCHACKGSGVHHG